MSVSDFNLARALAVADLAWNEIRESAFVQQSLPGGLSKLPQISFEEAERRSALGVELLHRIEGIDRPALPHDVGLTLAVVEANAKRWSREADWYWTVIDPLGVGFYGLFAPAVYTGGFLIGSVSPAAQRYEFKEPSDLDRYLAFIADYGRMIDQFRIRTAGQAERGIYMPKCQLDQAVALMRANRDQAKTDFAVKPERLNAVKANAFAVAVETRIQELVLPAYEGLLILLESDSYRSHAPDDVGIGQYPGAAEIYSELVKQHTTLELTPEQVHAKGHERMAEIREQMAAIRREIGFSGDENAYLEKIQTDARWRADTIEGVAAVFQRYIDRIAPKIDEYFNFMAKAPYTVAALPEAMAASATFGFYDMPKPGQPEGRYMFNGINLTKQSMLGVGALSYHELVPGHHMHIASQQENDVLHPVRKYSFFNAFNEGWAEYAATLAGEMGMYEEPEERYGRLMMDAFLTCRLVVDTGMNAFSWSLEQARDYMREHSFMSEHEIGTETVRYSTDIPAQALAYKLGDTEMFRLRHKMQDALGNRFDIRDFHAAVLKPGGLPLPLLETHIDHEIARLKTA